MKTIAVYALSVVAMAMLLQTTLAYPSSLRDDSDKEISDMIEIFPADNRLDKRRGMGWSSCSGFFKWRCGRRQMVLSKKIGAYSLH